MQCLLMDYSLSYGHHGLIPCMASSLAWPQSMRAGDSHSALRNVERTVWNRSQIDIALKIGSGVMHSSQVSGACSPMSDVR